MFEILAASQRNPTPENAAETPNVSTNTKTKYESIVTCTQSATVCPDAGVLCRGGPILVRKAVGPQTPPLGITAPGHSTDSIPAGCLQALLARTPSKELKVVNRELGTIERVSSEGDLSVRLDSGREIRFNIREHAHLDRGYAVTSHSSQGQTAEQVLIHVDTEKSELLVNNRFAYVSVSRAQYDAQIYTNDCEICPTLGSK